MPCGKTTETCACKLSTLEKPAPDQGKLTTALPRLWPTFKNSRFADRLYLDAMRDRLLLRRTGGGWVFIHRELLDFLATEPFGHTPAEVKKALAIPNVVPPAPR